MFQLIASLSFALAFVVPVSPQDQETEGTGDVTTPVAEASPDIATDTVETSAPQRGDERRKSRSRRDRKRNQGSAGRRKDDERRGRGSSGRRRESGRQGRSSGRRSGRSGSRSSQRRGGSGRGNSSRDRGRGRSRRDESDVSLEEIRDMLQEILERLDDLEDRNEEEEEEEERRGSGLRRNIQRGRPSARGWGGRGGRERFQRDRDDDEDDEHEGEHDNEHEADDDDGRSRSWRSGSSIRGRGGIRAADFDPGQAGRRFSASLDRNKDGTVSQDEFRRMPRILLERYGFDTDENMSVGEVSKKFAEGYAARQKASAMTREQTDDRRNNPAYANRMASHMGETIDQNDDGTIDEKELARFPESFRKRMNISGSISRSDFEEKAAAIFLQRVEDRSNNGRSREP